jgi:outer membrane protein assembly factor BamD
MRSRTLVFLAVILGVFMLSACGKGDKDKEKPPEPVEKLYNEALAKLFEKEYKDAVKAFEEVERQHPYSPWAIRAEIMAAYANYRDGKYDEAISSLDRFVKQHPGNDNTPYAYYLKALCYYEQITDVGRDQKITVQAQQALHEVVNRFPDSEYARDARLKIDLTADHLAGKEMEIGRYYERHFEYLAAINRFRTVVENYQTTSHTPEALERLVECYLKLGAVDQAKRYAAVLGYNYPGSTWYKDSYALMNGQPLPPQSDAKTGWHKWVPF